eukprot:TRINITY_DN13939_c0_g1_i1.p1 TRINITY_DN13939_c0_g1~~TRINITY_DN13939_c0_g1_i1.p1  ORF type:complete len:353 (+),score=62.75 TRINITY_DN13939_c0_g1_i1:35-1093(+)
MSVGEAVEPPRELSKFRNPTLRYIRVCDKVDHAKKTQRRVLSITVACVFVCEVGGGVKRYLPFEKIEKVVMAMWEGVVQIRFKVKNEHDVLLRFTHDPLNQTPAGPNEQQKILEILSKYSQPYLPAGKLLPITIETTEVDLTKTASLKKNPGFEAPYKVYNKAKKTGLPIVAPPPKPPQVEPKASPESLENEKRLNDLEKNMAKREQELSRKEAGILRDAARQEEIGLLGDLEPMPGKPDKLQISEEKQVTFFPSTVSSSSSYRKRTLSGLHSPRRASRQTAEYPPNSFWLSEGYRPTAMRASPMVPESYSEPTPATPAAALPARRHDENLDYWTRFVQRWEAQGIQHVEGL